MGESLERLSMASWCNGEAVDVAILGRTYFDVEALAPVSFPAAAIVGGPIYSRLRKPCTTGRRVASGLEAERA